MLKSREQIVIKVEATYIDDISGFVIVKVLS